MKYEDDADVEERYTFIYERLLDVTQEFSVQGATSFDVANVMIRFVVELTYDCAPDPQLATHLLLNAVTNRMERDIEKRSSAEGIEQGRSRAG